MFHCHLSLYKNRLKLDPRKAQTHEKDMAIWGLNYIYVWEQVILLRCLRTRNSLIKANSVLKGKLELWWSERFWIFTKTPWAALKITIKEHIILVKKKKLKKNQPLPPTPTIRRSSPFFSTEEYTVYTWKRAFCLNIRNALLLHLKYTTQKKGR